MISRVTSPNFKAGPPSAIYAGKRIFGHMDKNWAIEFARSTSNKAVQFLHEIGANNGENLNNVVTAIGTAGVAPIFIVNNPLAKEDKKTKLYSAWRQPISAGIALAVLTPVNNRWNRYVDKIAATEKIPEMDLSAKPPMSTIKKNLESAYEVERNKYYAGLNGKKGTFEPFVTKKEFVQKTKESIYTDLFFNELDKLRANSDIQVVKNVTPEELEILRQDKTKKYITTADMVKPRELKDARKEVFKKTMLEKYGIDISEGELAKKEIKTIEDFKKKAVGKRIIKEKNIDIKAFMKFIDETAPIVAENHVEDMMLDKTRIKFITSKARQAMDIQVDRATIEIHRKGLASLEDNVEIEAAKKEIFDNFVQKLKNKAAKLEGKNKYYYEEAIKKIERAGEVDKVKFHGVTMAQVERSAKLKHYQECMIKRSEEYLKNTKKKSGLIIGLLVLPLSCGLLNWIYPRFMEKFLPHLANAKKEPASGKEAK